MKNSKEPISNDKLKLIEGEDYYYQGGLMIFTQKYLSKRGYCCQSGCTHCPYSYKQKVDPEIPSELQDAYAPNDIDLAEKYLLEFED